MTIYNLDFVKELVNAFNVSNYGSEVNTNFVVEGDNIVVKFNCDQSSARKCLSQMARDLVREYYSDESVAGHFFDLKSFPFNFDKGRWTFNKAGTQFTVPICSGVIFNLKVHFAEEFRSEVRHQMIREVGGNSQHIKEILNKNIQQVAMDTSPHYIKCLWFNDSGIQAHFMKVLLAKMQKYSFNLLDFCRIDGNKVYFTDVENIDFVRSVTEVAKKRSGYHFRFPSSDDLKVRKYKGAMGELIFSLTGIPVYGYYRDNFIDKDRISNGDHFAFIPITKEGNNLRYLTRMEANKINTKFGYGLLTNVKGQTEATSKDEFIRSGIDRMYAFSDRQIALLIPVIIENSVINKDGQIEIDPELRFRALSRSPSTELSDMELDKVQPRYPTENRTLKELPRQGSGTEKEVLLRNPVNLAGTSERFSPRSHLSYTTVSQHAQPEKCVSAAERVQAASSWSLQDTHENKSTPSLQFTQSGLSGSLQPQQSFSGPLRLSSSGPGFQPYVTQRSPSAYPVDSGYSRSPPPPLIPSRDNVPGASRPLVVNPSSTSTGNHDSLPPPLIPSSSNVSGSRPPVVRSSSSRGAQAGANISEKEEKLIEALLYTFNLMNYILDGVYTNFFAKDGKIVSLLHDNVDREEYLQAVIDYIIEEYCGDEEEARELYDLDEFPFKFLPDPDYKKNKNDCEKNPKKTVVANISSGALSNLKILFSQKFKKDVDAIDINWVKKVEGREKDKWVDYQLSNGDSLEEACESCFPDEGPMKITPIALEEDEYVLDRGREQCEVELLFREQSRRFRGTLVNEEEKELFKALLYAFNYSNNNFDCPDTNFIVKNGEITSLIDDSVNVKEYLQKVRDQTKEEYCKDKKEAYDLNEFPFEFLSNCEKKKKMTVVANISRGALFNLRKLFIYGYGERGDINTKTVEEAVKSKKDGLVDFKLKGIEREGGYLSRIKPDEAVTASYPDENALEDIPIKKYKAGYRFERTYDDWETREYAQGRSEAEGKKEKMKPDNKDSGISSGEATDAENVSSKAEATASGSEYMDCQASSRVQQQNSWSEDEGNSSESSRSGSSNSSSKRALELSMENLTISTGLNATKTEQHSSKKTKR